MPKSPWWGLMLSNPSYRILGQSGALGEDAKEDAEEIAESQAIGFLVLLGLFGIYAILSFLLSLFGIDIWIL